MTKKNMSLFRVLLTLAANQSGHIGFGRRFPLMSPDDDNGGGGGGGNGGDPNKNADGSYKPEFVEKLLKEKNNWRDKAKDLEEKSKGNPPPKKTDDDNKSGDDDRTKLLAAKDEELKKEREARQKLENERKDGIKMGALSEEFAKNGGDPKKFELIRRLVDTQKVIIDEDSGVVYGTEGEIKRIKELAPELFGKTKKTVNDGDVNSNDRHDQDANPDEAFKKALDGARLKKDKEGKNPFEALYTAKGLKTTATRP